MSSGEASSTFGHANANFSVFVDRIKESISKEMNNDNDLNLHLHDQMSGWLRYCLCPSIIKERTFHF